MSAHNHVGETLRALRKGQKWSQTDLVTEMRTRGFEHWHQTTVSRTENGERPVHLDEGLALAEVFGVTPEALVGEAPVPRALSRSEALAKMDRLVQILKDMEDEK